MTDEHLLQQNITQALLGNAVISMADTRGTIIWVNDNFCRLCGYQSQELIGQNHSILSSHTHTNEFYQTFWGTINSGKVWHGELRNRKKNGKHYWDEVSIVPILDENNKPVQFIALHTDISTRKELFESLEKRAHHQGLLAILSRNAATNHNLQILLDQTISAVCSSLNMTMGMVLQHTTSNTLLLRSGCGQRFGQNGATEFEIDTHDVIHFAHASTEPVTIKDIAHDGRFSRNDFFNRQNISSGILLTLGKGETPWGILALFTDQETELQSDDILFISTIGNLLTESIVLYKTEAQLASEKDLSQKYLDMANVMFIALNDKEEIILVNQKATSLLGYKQNELLGMNWFDHFEPESSRETTRALFRLTASNPYAANNAETDYTIPVTTRHGDTRLVKWRNKIIYDNNRFSCLLSAGEDITDQIKAEKEKEHMQQELMQAKKMEAIGHLAAGITHDFNNILTTIIGYAGLALERQAAQNDSKLTGYLGEVESAGQRAKSIITQLANFGKSGNSSLQPTLLPTLVKGTLKMLRSAIPESISFEQHINMDTPAVLIDAEQFNQLMTYLLIHVGNELRNSGKLCVELNTQTVPDNFCTSCGKTVNGNLVQLTILYNKIFPGEAAFRTLFDIDAPQHGSSELMYIHHLVHASSGHMLIQPAGNDSTQIRILFSATTQESTQANGIPANKTGARIMIVDDENSVAGYLGELLEHCQYKTSVFADATDALKSFMAAPDHYDLILTDQTMPQLTGLELSKRILAIRPDIPIVLMTGYSDTVDENIATGNRIRGFLQKPFETHKFLECIYRLLAETGK